MILKSAQTAKIGKIFQDKRLLRWLSVEEASAQTIINIEHIKAIESGDYSIFPARVFALKYYEKYAQFLGVKQPFFDIYNSETVADNPQRVLKANIFIENIKFFIVGFSALIFLAIYLVSSQQDKALTMPLKQRVEILELNIIEPPEIHRDQMNIINSQINSFEGSQHEDLKYNHPQEFEVLGGLKNLLSFEFIQDSWIEVYEGDEQLIYQLSKAGEKLTITITPPFKITVGNALGVIGFYNEKEINFTQATNKLNVSSVEVIDE